MNHKAEIITFNGRYRIRYDLRLSDNRWIQTIAGPYEIDKRSGGLNEVWETKDILVARAARAMMEDRIAEWEQEDLHEQGPWEVVE